MDAFDHTILNVGVAVIVIAVLFAIWLRRSEAAHRRRIKARLATMREQGLDPMAASDRVRQLAASGRKTTAIRIYIQETGAGYAAAKILVEQLSEPSATDGPREPGAARCL